jgi:hypothetical protein
MQRDLSLFKLGKSFSFLCHSAPLQLFLICWLALAGCVPAQVPDVLTYTPGPPVVITDRTVTTIAFRLTYPGRAWKVVTSEAGAPPSVYLVAPDGTSFIRVHVGPPDAADQPAPDYRFEQREFTLPDGTPIVAILSAPADAWEPMLDVFERVVGSVVSSR